MQSFTLQDITPRFAKPYIVQQDSNTKAAQLYSMQLNTSTHLNLDSFEGLV